MRAASRHVSNKALRELDWLVASQRRTCASKSQTYSPGWNFRAALMSNEAHYALSRLPEISLVPHPWSLVVGIRLDASS
jgi:hypothetical protein